MISDYDMTNSSFCAFLYLPPSFYRFNPSLPPGSLECFPREELEQRLRSSMIMVEALVQQLTAARAQGRPSAGPAPSELREKMVQTDHTELSQVKTHSDSSTRLTVGDVNNLKLGQLM